MSMFSLAAKQVDDEHGPGVVGFTAKPAAAAEAAAVSGAVAELLRDRFGFAWSVRPSDTGWLDALPASPPSAPIPLDAAWNATYALAKHPGIDDAEPLLLFRVPAPDTPEPDTQLAVWRVPYSAETRRRIEEESRSSLWSLDRMRVLQAHGIWKGAGSPGAGVLVAHPDTGYTLHPQIRDNLDGPGKNFVDPDSEEDALDPLSSAGLLPNPGHGTSTASVICSPHGDIQADGRPEAEVCGVAPGARILPLRVSTSVVHFNFLNVSQALEEAVRRGAHVVSMSLGGAAASKRLRAAVQLALDNGLILVAAAGNELPIVGFPAALPGVVAMAACNPLDMAWNRSGFGEEVVATAPGERVWHARTVKKEDYTTGRGDGTSFATAAVAGIAALWLSHHGREKLLAQYGKDLLPFAFHKLLQETADGSPEFIRGGKGGFGAGVVNAEALLRAGPPSVTAVRRHRKVTLERQGGDWFNLTLREIGMLMRVSTRPHEGRRMSEGPEAVTPDPARVQELLVKLLGPDNSRDRFLLSELTMHLAGTRGLHRLMQRVGLSLEATLPALRRALLRRPLSAPLRESLSRMGAADPRASSAPSAAADRHPPVPPVRQLRAYAYDPSLATRLSTAAINQVCVEIPFEADLQPGPVGEYLEVVDVDPASDCAYAPVDLNHPHILALDGLAPSEGNPQFHQQMVYAVAMKTIRHFEEALGRPVFWSPLRPWLEGNGDSKRAEPRMRGGNPDLEDQFVQRLRVYPHALREENAYYSPAKRALLFGYFPARDGDPGNEYPGGMVFTCLSHDIIAHETTHAVLDGMHTYFNEPTNPDVFALHEAFADIVALFQHFTYPEVLRHQIARTRGNLTSQHLLSQLAQQFGQATGKHHALRDAIGGLVERKASEDAAKATVSGPAGSIEGERRKRQWQRYEPNPQLLEQRGYAEEAHDRGSILVAAVFDAFLAIYSQRVADLLRIATGGTGVLPAGELHPDLVNRMAHEAAKSAQQVLRICIRAMDYVPPVDITFGEFLRAVITADRDLVPNDNRGYRVAFIEAFRAWGIYPRDVRTLSEESLVWHSPPDLYLFPPEKINASDGKRNTHNITRTFERLLRRLRTGSRRQEIFEEVRSAQRILNRYLRSILGRAPDKPRHPLGEVLRHCLLQDNKEDPRTVSFSLANLRPARRIGPHGEFLTELVFEVVRSVPLDEGDTERRFRGGITVIVNAEDWRVRYLIYKRLMSTERRDIQRGYQRQALTMGFGAAEYHCPEPPAGWEERRGEQDEAMRSSSCACRRTTRRRHLREPFALLHHRDEEELVPVPGGSEKKPGGPVGTSSP